MRFPHRVNLQSPTKTQNDFNESVVTWVDFKTNIYASVKNVSGKETNDSDQTQNFIAVSVRIRNRPGISEDMRVIHNGRKLRILAILPDETNKYLDLKCEHWTDS